MVWDPDLHLSMVIVAGAPHASAESASVGNVTPLAGHPVALRTILVVTARLGMISAVTA